MKLQREAGPVGSTTADYLLEWPAGITAAALTAVYHPQHLDFKPIQLPLQAPATRIAPDQPFVIFVSLGLSLVILKFML